LKFTFDVSKCYRIFDELLKLGNVKISHIIPPLDEIKRRAYCKFHNSYSHATNDCNVFHRQIQSAINEGRLMLHEMQVDKQPFPINTMELQQPKVLVRPHQAEATKGKNVMVGETKPDLRGKELTREVAYEKTLDGRETFKITVKASGHGGARIVHGVWSTYNRACP
jgi:ABC-type sulfate/molybdate transport systems ATPase subunit